MNKILKGDIYYIKPFFNEENSKGRPAVVISNNDNNYYSTNIQVCYLTKKSADKDYPMHVSVDRRIEFDGKVNEEMLTAIIACERISTVEKSRISGKRVGRAADELLEDINKALCVQLDIGETVV